MNEEIPLRDQILETSRHFLFEKGHSSLSMRKIANKIGVSATSIYLYFDNKDHLLHTLIEESVEELSVAIELAAEEANGPIDRFEAIINGYVDFAFNKPEKYQVIYMVRSEAMARYPKEKFRKARRCYELLVKTIQEGIAKRVIKVEKPMVAAYSIWAQLHGVVSVVLNQRLDSRIDRKEFLKESVNHIVEGFLVRTTVS
ncbi:MAG: TetR/AcrR family transcriptional regulator [Balneolaceae bacterium]|nr:TetR/AcrR family transcriptional regulator [Balneolaceae bacterium]